MSISDAMAATSVSSVDLTRYVAVPDDITVAETVTLMSAAGRSCACVLSGDDLVGIFTQRDVVQRVIGRPGSFNRPISEEMTRPVRTMRNSDSVADGLALMNHWWVRSVPVSDEDDRLVGNLSFYTVMDTIANMLRSRISGSVGEATAHHGLTLVDFTGLNMSAPVIVNLDDPVEVAIHHMRARGIGSVLVVDERENLAGELTEFHLQTRIGCNDSDLSKRLVRDVMDPNPISLDARSAIADGISELLSHEVSHVPLTGESGRPVGVASFRDIAMYVETILETLG
ncbi:MAG: CBS domain-containing protein [Acidimicrobiia bacterium]|nr:CBS domain-containing protein [Acidimicrobiia bacterium]